MRDGIDLRQHQAEGVDWLRKRPSWLLADDLGLGKTLQALIVAAHDFDSGFARRVLVVANATLKYNWADEIEKWTTFTYAMLEGTPKQRDKILNEFDADILIANYEQVKAHLAVFNEMNFDIFIGDEFHLCKNPKSKRTKATLSVLADRYFLLTGSPMLNRVNELWTALHRVDPTGVPNYYQFCAKYCNTPDAPILMANGTLKSLGDVKVGDQVMGWHVPEVSTARRGGSPVRAETNSPNRRRMMCPATVEFIMERRADIYEYTLDDGTTFTCTRDHQWLSGSHGGGSGDEYIEWVTAQPRDRGRAKGTKLLSRVVEIPSAPTPEQQRAADWLSGLCDGEASWPYIAQSRTANPIVYAQIGRALDLLELDYRMDANGYTVRSRQARNAIVKMLAWGSFAKTATMERFLVGQLNKTKVRVVSERKIGRGTVLSMQTSTGNYVAWGLASKNCVYGGYEGKQIVGVKNQRQLKALLENIMLRRLKVDVLDLPEKQIIPVLVDLHPEQARVYKEAWDEMQITLPHDPNPMEIENVLTRFLRLKQICSTTANIEGMDDHSYKLDRAIEIIEEVQEHVVVFTQFRGTQRAMMQRLAKAKIPAFELHGDVKPADRVEIVKKWSATPGATIVCMIQVAGVGLNMTAASKEIFLDKLFVPKLNEQAQDRCYRMGADLTKPVQIFEIIARKTIEQRIESILREKTQLFNELIETPTWKREFFKALLEANEDA